MSLRPCLSAVVLLGAFVCGPATAAEPAAPGEVRLVTWNVRELFTTGDVAERAQDFQRFAAEVRPDVLVVQEVTSLKVVTALRDAMGLAGYHVACSDFEPSDIPDHAAFEVGIISRFPLTQVLEYDPSPDFAPGRGAADELPLAPAYKLGVKQAYRDTRGFLWARIEALGWTVVAVHLKSSRGVDGTEDLENAARREFVAAQVALGVLEDQRLWPAATAIVAGDFNVGHADAGKNGRSLLADAATSAEGADLYDDTHALFRDGLVGGLRMTNLVGHVRTPTYPSFPSTPIDNIYVAGPAAEWFAPATVSTDTYGSDHCPVWAVRRPGGP